MYVLYSGTPVNGLGGCHPRHGFHEWILSQYNRKLFSSYMISPKKLSILIIQISNFCLFRKSDLLIFLSTNSFHNLLYDTATIISPTDSQKSFSASYLPLQQYHTAMHIVVSHVRNSRYKQSEDLHYLSLL